MSTQSDLNTYPWQFVLYYCHVGNSDATVYQTDLSDVCTLGFDGSGNITISSWLIGGYGAPSTGTLLAYTLANVLADYNNYYAIPIAIKSMQQYQISATALAAIRSDASLLGCVIYDTTADTLRTWNGSAWQSGFQRFLALDGTNSMSGTLALGAQKVTMRGLPADVSLYSGPSVAVNNTTTETTILPSAGSLGSLVLAAGQPVGMNIDFTFWLAVSSTLGDTLTLRIKSQAGTLYTNAITVPASSAGLLLQVKGMLTVQASTAQVNSMTRTGTLNYITNANAAYDPSIQNTLDVTVQWGSNVNTCTMNQSYMGCHFRNG